MHNIDNLNVNIIEDINCFNISEADKKNSDIYIYYSNNFYNEEYEKKLRNFASKMSSMNKKRVTICYLYQIDKEKSFNENYSKKMKIMSFKNQKLSEQTTYVDNNTSIYDAVEMTKIIHNNNEYDVKKRVRKLY